MKRSFFQSPRFRAAWMASLFAGAFFPFVDAALATDPDLPYLIRVNTDFLQKALSFAGFFFVFQCLFAVVLYRRDVKAAQDQIS